MKIGISMKNLSKETTETKIMNRFLKMNKMKQCRKAISLI